MWHWRTDKLIKIHLSSPNSGVFLLIFQKCDVLFIRNLRNASFIMDKTVSRTWKWNIWREIEGFHNVHAIYLLPEILLMVLCTYLPAETFVAYTMLLSHRNVNPIIVWGDHHAYCTLRDTLSGNSLPYAKWALMSWSTAVRVL